ncbi:hypothetical protein [Sphaerisporangium corydalis]|uniref:DUF4352 domain-containing protein n=1 Tax=Sphaerisporangium corydalis TaxID=1441875 RepID=A0ABV9EPN2_9ACTN|nr:hypothetical protein [Sphaerisporangium corydalis]
MTSPVHRGSRRRRPILVPAIVLLAAAGIGAVAALGGLKRAPVEGPPWLRAGQEIDQDVFRTRIDGALVHYLPADDPAVPSATVMDLDLRVYNDAKVSVPLSYLEKSLLRVASADGKTLMAPDAKGWLYDSTVPGEGAASRLLPPKRTSAVVIRFREVDSLDGESGGGRFPDVLAVDLARYENHQDSLTGRRAARLVPGDDDRPSVAAHVTVPVRKAV